MLVVSDLVRKRGSAPGGVSAVRVFSDGYGALDDLVLQHDADHQEDEVQHEHDEAQQLAHAPLTGRDGDDDEEEHEEEEHDGTEEAIGADLYRTQPAEQWPQEPREGQPADTNTSYIVRYAVNKIWQCSIIWEDLMFIISYFIFDREKKTNFELWVESWSHGSREFLELGSERGPIMAISRLN